LHNYINNYKKFIFIQSLFLLNIYFYSISISIQYLFLFNLYFIQSISLFNLCFYSISILFNLYLYSISVFIKCLFLLNLYFYSISIIIQSLSLFNLYLHSISVPNFRMYCIHCLRTLPTAQWHSLPRLFEYKILISIFAEPTQVWETMHISFFTFCMLPVAYDTKTNVSTCSI
jgi:hypothetical protein